MERNDTSSNIVYKPMAPPTPRNSPPSIVMERVSSAPFTMDDKHKMSVYRPWVFLVGLFLSTGGACLFLASVFCNDWVHFTDERPNIPKGRQRNLVAKYGPFEACNHGGECGQLWKMVPGLNMVPVRLTQAVFAAAACLYTLGLLLIVKEILCIPGCGHVKRYVPFHGAIETLGRKVTSVLFPEIVLPLAAVTGFISMLLMGQLKLSVILRERQAEHVGPCLYGCLVAVITTVIGIICVVLNRITVDSGKLVKFVYLFKKNKEMRAAKWKTGVSSESSKDPDNTGDIVEPPKDELPEVLVQTGARNYASGDVVKMTSADQDQEFVCRSKWTIPSGDFSAIESSEI